MSVLKQNQLLLAVLQVGQVVPVEVAGGSTSEQVLEVAVLIDGEDEKRFSKQLKPDGGGGGGTGSDNPQMMSQPTCLTQSPFLSLT